MDRSLIAALREDSAKFAEVWARHEVAFRRGERKRLNHPALGLLHINCRTLISEDGRQRLLWFTPVAGTGSAEALELLAVIGTQKLTEQTPKSP